MLGLMICYVWCGNLFEWRTNMLNAMLRYICLALQYVGCDVVLHMVWKLLSLLLLKEVGNAILGESDLHPISPKTPTTQYQPRERKNEG